MAKPSGSMRLLLICCPARPLRPSNEAGERAGLYGRCPRVASIAQHGVSHAGGRSNTFLRVKGLAPCEHLHELFDAALARLGSLGVGDPIEDGVAVLAAQPPEHLISSWLR